MKLLDRIKKFFTGEKPKEKEINEDSDSFIEKKEKELEEKFREKMELLFYEILSALAELEKNVDVLENLDVEKKKAHDREKYITKLGQADYVDDLKKLISRLKEKKEDEISHLTKELEEFSRYSNRSYHKATVLIGKEITSIRESIKKIWDIRKNFLQENAEFMKNLKKIRNLKSKVQKKNEEEKAINDIENEKKGLKIELGKNEEGLRKLEKQISEIKNSGSYRKNSELISEKEKLIREIEKIEFRVKTLFDRKILEKYIYIGSEKADEKLVRKYLDNPVEMVFHDSEFNILNVAEKIKEKISSGEISTKDKEKELKKVGVKKEEIENLRNELEKSRSRLEETETEIKKDTTYSELENLMREKSQCEDKITDGKNEIEALEKKIKRLTEQLKNCENEIMESVENF